MSTALCPVLVGRDTEVGMLTAVLDRAANQHGGMIFLAGEPGVGKSRLAREIADLAESRGSRVFAGRASDSGARIPYRPVTEALMRAARAGFRPDLHKVGEYRAALGSLVPEWRPAAADAGAETSGPIMGEGLLRLLASCGGSSALLVLEDLQWADEQTLAVVRYLTDQVSEAGVVCLATVRDSELSDALDFARSAEARGRAALITLPRLTPAAVELMAAACDRRAPMPEAVRELLDECEGLPFAVEEVLAAMSEGDDSATPGGRAAPKTAAASLPVSITRSVAQRLAMLGPDVRAVLQAAAVLGIEFDEVSLLAVADVPADAASAALDGACDALLVEAAESGERRFRFRHSLTRRAVLDGLLAPDRAELSRRASAAIERDHPGLPDDWCEIAAELHTGAGNYVRAATLMLEAGRRAAGRGALMAARSLLEAAAEALARTPGADTILDLDIDEALFRVLVLIGDAPQLAAAAGRIMAVLEHPAVEERRRAQLMIMTARVVHQPDLDAAVAQLDAGRELGGQLGDNELTSSADAEAARCAADSGDLEGAIKRAQSSLDAAVSAGLTGWAADNAVEALQVIGRQERVRDIAAARSAFERAYQIATDAGSVTQRVGALIELGTIEMLDEGSGRQLAAAGELAHASGALSAAAVIDLKLGLLQTLGTDLDQARKLTSRCEQKARRIGAARVEALAITAQALASAIDGDPEAAETLARRAESVMPGNAEILFTTHGLVRVAASLSRDDVASALSESDIAMAYADDVPENAPRLAWALWPLLHAITGPDGPAALDRARAESLAMKWNRGFFAYADAVIAGRNGDLRQATALASRAEEMLTPFAPRWNHLARWLVAPSAFEHSWGEPVRWLHDASASFTESAQHQLAASCQATLRRAGHAAAPVNGRRASVPEPLRSKGITAREMDILRLVADGLSNSQIAQRLCLSRKTVESHVASLIAKTDRSGRCQLVADAARTFAT